MCFDPFPLHLGFLISFILWIPVSVGLDANVSLSTTGNGYHRELIYQVAIDDFEKKNCHVALYVELPAALYVNVDELADLRRSNITNACATGEINVELFMEKAQPQSVTVCKSLISATTELRFPIHLRYQYPKENGGYNEIVLPRPKLLLGCIERLKEYRISKANLCLPCANIVNKWREVPYPMEQEDLIWLVPVGDVTMSTIVNSVTILMTILGAIFIAKTLYYAPLIPPKKDE